MILEYVIVARNSSQRKTAISLRYRPGFSGQVVAERVDHYSNGVTVRFPLMRVGGVWTLAKCH